MGSRRRQEGEGLDTSCPQVRNQLRPGQVCTLTPRADGLPNILPGGPQLLLIFLRLIVYFNIDMMEDILYLHQKSIFNYNCFFAQFLKSIMVINLLLLFYFVNNV